MSKTAGARALLLIAACITSGCMNERILRDSGSERVASTNSNQAADTTFDSSGAPYVPTHQAIVDEMLELANVTGDDVLYDLGSGDGRIPITAALRYGTRGVGIDIDPALIREANQNATNAKVEDKVRFIEGDIFEQDFATATVVMLYLSPELNLKLRPRLVKMRSGTRIVSHNHDMGDWPPNLSKTVKTPSGVEHTIYLWEIP